MIKAIHFTNFKVLRSAILPLGRLTVVVGPNGSGKSTALQALQVLAARFGSSVPAWRFEQLRSAGDPFGDEAEVELAVEWQPPFEKLVSTAKWTASSFNGDVDHEFRVGTPPNTAHVQQAMQLIRDSRVFALSASAIAKPVLLRPDLTLGDDGSGLAGVLDNLRDTAPERFEQFNSELARWLPEFDRVLFETPQPGHRAIALRASGAGYRVGAGDLSQGTLLALTLLTVAHLSNPPRLIGFEEPERGLHPRLLRDVQDALFRLAYPENFGESRPPSQVVVTTHSPYLLDLFREYPEQVVIAEKTESGAHFSRLIDRKEIDEILRDTQLGDAWYSGVLGGVPARG
jgi:predicted ATPase